MKIKEVKDQVTVYDVYEQHHPNSPADALQDEQKYNIINTDIIYPDMSMIMEISNVARLRTREKRANISITKPIPDEFKTFGNELLDKSKDKLLDITEADQIANRRSDMIELQNIKTNSTHSLQSNTPEQAELRWSYYRDLFRDDSDMKVVSPMVAAVGNDNAIEKQDSIFSTEVNISVTTLDCDSTPSTKTDTDDTISNGSIVKASEDDALSAGEGTDDEAKRAERKEITFKHLLKLQREYKNMDLFNNISQAALQNRLSLDDSNSTEAHISDASLDMSKKSGIASNGVIKFLQLDDESISEESVNKYSPLNNMHETKEIVIPKYLKDVPDGIKELMLDLVQPISDDSLTFKNLMVDKGIPTNTSTLSTQILGNLVTSSQVDLQSESCSNPERYFYVDDLNSLTSTVTSNNSESESLRSPIHLPDTEPHFDDAYSKTRLLYTRAALEQSSLSEVIVFDHLNPLNNVLLRPINYLEAHKYNPMKSDEANCQSLSIHHNPAKRDDTSENVEVRTVTIKQHEVRPELSKMQEEDQIISFLRSHSINKEEQIAKTDNISKFTEVPVQEQFRSNCNAYITKDKAQMHSSSKEKRIQQQSSVKLTLKPIENIQKDSSGPKVQMKVPQELLATNESSSSSTLIDELSLNMTPKNDVTKNTDRKAHRSKTHDKKSPKSKAMKLGQTVTVRKFKTDSTGLDTGSKDNNICKNELLDHGNLNLNAKSESFIEFSLSDMSFASSNNINPMMDILSTSSLDCESPHECIIQDVPLQGNWHPEAPPSDVLVFDYLNSLNNVLLPPINNAYNLEPHKYNPMTSAEKPRENKRKTPENETGFKCNHSHEINFNQASRGDTTRNFEVRTVTIKQDPVTPLLNTTQEENQTRKHRLPLVNIEEEAAETENVSNSSEVSLLQDPCSSNPNANLPKNKKGKSRQQQTSVEMSRKPIRKMRMSNPKFQNNPVELLKINEWSPNMEPVKNNRKSTNHSTTAADVRLSKICDKRLPKTVATKKGQNILQQSVIDEIIIGYTDFDTGYDKYNASEKNLLDDINSILNPMSEIFTEFTQSDELFILSKNLNPMKDNFSTSNTDPESPRLSIMQVIHPKVELNPELICATRPSQYDSGVNVVAKIDMLPFMGSHECEWGSSSADTWSFRLLHGRLRLTARLAHRLDNATRTRVRGDTPVLNIAVEALQHDKEDLVATMCVRFALQTMHHMVLSTLRTKCYADDIPPLLQRCAAVVRVALRWARAIADAKLRLTYTMDSDGNLSLKVANIPLRSIWEVTMHIELVLNDAQTVPWPRACDVCVLPVVADVVVPDEDVRRALAHTPKDWAHAPSTIWRVFRLLKHKKRDS